MAADFTSLSTALTAQKATIATQAAKIATDAAAVAALATTAIGAEADTDRFSRLRRDLFGTIGQLVADCSVLAGSTQDLQAALAAEFQAIRRQSGAGITNLTVPTQQYGPLGPI